MSESNVLSLDRKTGYLTNLTVVVISDNCLSLANCVGGLLSRRQQRQAPLSLVLCCFRTVLNISTASTRSAATTTTRATITGTTRRGSNEVEVEE